MMYSLLAIMCYAAAIPLVIVGCPFSALALTTVGVVFNIKYHSWQNDQEALMKFLEKTK